MVYATKVADIWQRYNVDFNFCAQFCPLLYLRSMIVYSFHNKLLLQSLSKTEVVPSIVIWNERDKSEFIVALDLAGINNKEVFGKTKS